ncbi:MAG: hypothetical protein HQ518_07305 [Rhodopirellula sp.]|nr:hypothetical protein [Rhodopirellula sp.]
MIEPPDNTLDRRPSCILLFRTLQHLFRTLQHLCCIRPGRTLDRRRRLEAVSHPLQAL